LQKKSLFVYILNMITLEQGLRAQGVEVLTTHTPVDVVDPIMAAFVGLKNSLPLKKIRITSNDGVEIDRQARMIPLFGEGFELAKMLADVSPMVYLPGATGGYIEAMLSPNYDAHGHKQRPTLRALPVAKTGILIDTSAKGLWLPDANQVMALAGGVSMEKPGVGGHGSGTGDVEHKNSVMGALSKNDLRLARSHAQHDVREEGGSAAHQLSNGKLGTLYAPGQIENFSGFGEPIEFDGKTKNQTNVMFMPDNFFDHPDQVFGALLRGPEGLTPEQFITGLGLGVLEQRGQLQQLDTYTKEMEDGVGNPAVHH
jgi:hypothetical protein